MTEGHALCAAMLVVLALGMFSRLPVAVVLIGVGLGFGLLGAVLEVLRIEHLGAMFFRVFGTLTDADDVAFASVPLLICMGAVLHEIGLARDLLDGLHALVLRRASQDDDRAGASRAALGIAVIMVGVVLGPLAGIVGASVSALALMAVPSLLARGYRPHAACGVVTAAGTLGVAIPPSVMLFFVADGLGVQVPALYLAMIGPALLLTAAFAGFVLLEQRHARSAMPLSSAAQPLPAPGAALRALVDPLVLIAAVSVPIIAGWATLSEGAAIGLAGTLLIGARKRRLTWAALGNAVHRTLLVTGVIFFIFVGATAFSLTFRLLGGSEWIADGLRDLALDPPGRLVLILATLFVLGMFFDWLEIVIVTFPILKPILGSLVFSGHIEPAYNTALWIAVLLTLNLQSSFLTPPFGYALFLMKGASPAGIGMRDIYRGAIPYVCLQVAVIVIVALLPAIATWLPDRFFDLSIPRAEKFNE